ncbi:superoxide dismutase family protein [Streptosporangium sp. NPDC048047]|uniref:superoxide dismutase family protein n=1 Tax=Streptosporangium sp. NPDC048047 TaxID=3155748 RepID=UPI0034443822
MLRGIHLTLALALGAGAATVGAAAPAPRPPGDGPSARPSGPAGEPSAGPFGGQVGATIKDADGRTVGMLRIAGTDSDKPRVVVVVRDLTPGQHAFHIHAKGVCDPKAVDPATGSPFASAGPHFDLDSEAHPYHSGDLPDLMVGQDGTGRAALVTDRFRVQQLFDADGSSVVIHALSDNHANIPDRYRSGKDPAGPDAETLKAGDSGRRVACGVIER